MICPAPGEVGTTFAYLFVAFHWVKAVNIHNG